MGEKVVSPNRGRKGSFSHDWEKLQLRPLGETATSPTNANYDNYGQFLLVLQVFENIGCNISSSCADLLKMFLISV